MVESLPSEAKPGCQGRKRGLWGGVVSCLLSRPLQRALPSPEPYANTACCPGCSPRRPPICTGPTPPLPCFWLALALGLSDVQAATGLPAGGVQAPSARGAARSREG